MPTILEEEPKADPRQMMDDRRRERLFKAVAKSYRDLKHYRELNKQLVEEYAGPEYLGDETRPKKYINLLAQAVDAYVMLLVGGNPRVWVTTYDPNLRGFARHFRTNLNALMDEIELRDVFEEWVRNAFFSLGIIKVHMADSGELIAEDDILMDPGIPFASVVSIDDWVHDTQARRMSECKFQGDMYRIPFDELKNGMFDAEAIKDLQPSSPYSGEERTEDIARDPAGEDGEFEEMIDLIDLYLPRDGMVYTFAVDDRRTCTLKGRPLAVMEWTGRETGPYKKLALSKVPEKVMPVPPASYWLTLDRLANNLMRKASRQARRTKEVMAYTPQGAEGAKKVHRADDGDMVEVADVNEMASMRFGGVDSSVNAFMLQTMELFDRMSGNLSAILGLGASSDTVGQEKLIHGATSRVEQSLTQRVLGAGNDVVCELANMLFHDEFKVIPNEVSLEGFPDIRADSTWLPGDREGMFTDYKVQVDVYSMQYQGPADRVAVLNSLIQQVFTPLVQLLQAQGGTIDMAALTSKYSEMLSQPDLSEIIRFNQPINSELPQQEGPRKSPVSNRTYTRRNVSGGREGGVPQNAVPEPATPKS